MTDSDIFKSNAQSIKDFQNALSICREDGEALDLPDSTRFQSECNPLRYGSGRLIEENDYVINISFNNEGEVADIDFAQVWANLYYADDKAIGVCLKHPAGSNSSSPPIHAFTHQDSDGVERRYFRGKLTISKKNVTLSLAPLNHEGEIVNSPSEKWFQHRVKRLAEQGDGAACFVMYYWQYYYENKPLPALEYLQSAVESGYPHAFTIKARSSLYQLEGSIEDKDLFAFKLFTKGAKLGDPLSIHELAYAYAQGRVVQKNDGLAYKLFKKASLHLPKSLYARGIYYRYGTFAPLFRDYFYKPPEVPKVALQPQKAFKIFKYLALPDLLNDVYSGYELARCYEEGFGVKQDADRAQDIFQKIANSGFNASEDYDFPPVRESQSKVYGDVIDKILELKANGQREEEKKLISQHIHFLENLLLDNHPEATYIFAHEMLKGEIVEQDRERAFEHFLNLCARDELSREMQQEASEILLTDDTHPYYKAKEMITHLQDYNIENISNIAYELRMFHSRNKNVLQAHVLMIQELARRGDMNGLWQLAKYHLKGEKKWWLPIEYNPELSIQLYHQCFDLFKDTIQDKFSIQELKDGIKECQASLPPDIAPKYAKKTQECLDAYVQEYDYTEVTAQAKATMSQYISPISNSEYIESQQYTKNPYHSNQNKVRKEGMTLLGLLMSFGIIISVFFMTFLLVRAYVFLKSIV